MTKSNIFFAVNFELALLLYLVENIIFVKYKRRIVFIEKPDKVSHILLQVDFHDIVQEDLKIGKYFF